MDPTAVLELILGRDSAAVQTEDPEAEPPVRHGAHSEVTEELRHPRHGRDGDLAGRLPAPARNIEELGENRPIGLHIAVLLDDDSPRLAKPVGDVADCLLESLALAGPELFPRSRNHQGWRAENTRVVPAEAAGEPGFQRLDGDGRCRQPRERKHVPVLTPGEVLHDGFDDGLRGPDREPVYKGSVRHVEQPDESDGSAVEIALP